MLQQDHNQLFLNPWNNAKPINVLNSCRLLVMDDGPLSHHRCCFFQGIDKATMAKEGSSTCKVYILISDHAIVVGPGKVGKQTCRNYRSQIDSGRSMPQPQLVCMETCHCMTALLDCWDDRQVSAALDICCTFGACVHSPKIMLEE